METQCDAFKPRNAPEKYVPPKVGFDASTQSDLNNIFDFDRDVKPIVSNLVDKSLEQSLMEVRQEEVLKQLKREKINLNLKETNRNEEMKSRLSEENENVKNKDQRKRKGREKMLRIKELIKKAQMWSQLGTVAGGMKNGCQQQLKHLNLNESKLDLIVQNQIMPYLYEKTSENVRRAILSAKLADDLLESAVRRLEKRVVGARIQMKKLRIRLRLEEKEIGPFVMEPNSKISDLKTQILTYLNAENPEKEVTGEDVEIFSGTTSLNLEELVNSSSSRNLVVHLKTSELEPEEESQPEAEAET